MRILVLGAGVIGSVYAGKLAQAGHDVVLLARGPRLVDLQTHGLILQDARSGNRSVLPVPSVSQPVSDDHFDLVLVAVRAGQLTNTLPVLTDLADDPPVLFFGNTANRQEELTAALGDRAVFGFPAAGGTRDGPVVKYVLISQQKTMLGETDGTSSPRVRHLQSIFTEAGFPTLISANMKDWLLAHAAFVVPIAFALYRVGVSPARLAADPVGMRLMVLPPVRRSPRCGRTATTRSPPTCATSTASRPGSSPATGAGCSTVPEENCGSARTAGRPRRRCASWPTSSRKSCSTPGTPRQTFSGCWLPASDRPSTRRRNPIRVHARLWQPRLSGR